ncbi:MAG: ATP-binding protein [Pseudomonadota bacterium]
MRAESSAAQELDLDLLPVFLAEAEELLPRIETGLALLRAGLADLDALRRLQRSLHTLKGTARMTGALALGEAVHRLELRLKALVDDSMQALASIDLSADLAQIQALLQPLRDMPQDRCAAAVEPGAGREATLEVLADRLHRVCDQTALALRKRVHLCIEDNGVYFAPGRLDVLAAPLDHLVRNAVVHGIEPGEVRRQAGKPAWGQIRVEANWSERGLGIEVCDDGAGIEASLLDRIFEPGFSTAGAVNHTAGLGIGLDAVQAVVSEMGGTIQVASEPGRGSCFRISLPA